MVEFEHLSDKAKQDLVLVEEAKKGKQAAYAELMDRYRDSIYFTMLKMVKNTITLMVPTIGPIELLDKLDNKKPKLVTVNKAKLAK